MLLKIFNEKGFIDLHRDTLKKMERKTNKSKSYENGSVKKLR